VRISQGVSATGQSLVQGPIARAGARRAWGRLRRCGRGLYLTGCLYASHWSGVGRSTFVGCLLASGRQARFATRLAIGTLFDCFCVSVIVGGSSPLKGV
jgi:hypothetical protein